MALFELIIVAVIVWVYFTMPGTCSTPINIWLMILSITLLVHIFEGFLFTAVTSFASEQTLKTVKDISVFSGIAMSCIVVALTGLGSWWYFTASGCADDWAAGNALTLALLIFGYVIIGCLICGSATAGVFICIGSGLTTKAEYETLK